MKIMKVFARTMNFSGSRSNLSAVAKSRQSSPVARVAALLCVAAVAVFAVAGCGGGGSTITLEVSPTAAQTLDQGQSVNFYAVLGNDTANAGVTWQPLTGTGCAGTGCGTLSNVTTTSVTYTAPAGLSTSLTVSLEAIAVDNHSATKTVTITVVLPPTFPTTVPTTLANGANGVGYNQTITATNGVSPLTYKITPGSGSLPSGLTLNSTGSIVGTPTGPLAGQPNPATFTITVTDSATTPLSVVSPQYSILVNPAPKLSVTATTLPNGTVNAPYSAGISSTGGVTPLTWNIVSGSIPPGLTFNTNSGQITGTPTQAGAYSFTPAVVDSSIPPQNVTGKTLTITVSNATPLQATTPPLPTATVASPYSGNLVATGGVPPYTWSIVTGQLPAGLILDSATGRITGSPVLVTSTSVVAQVSDSESTPVSASQPLTITVVTGSSSTNSLLSGSYSFLFQGFDSGGNVVIAGNFTSNGSGVISSGQLDSNRKSGLFTASTLTGTYTLGSDGRGTMELIATNNKGAILVTDYLLVIDSNKNIRIIENDTTGTHGSGIMKPVVGNSLSPSNFSGNYAFQLTGQDNAGKPMAITGVVRADGSALLSPGMIDVNEGGTYTPQLALSGNFNVSTANEKGVLYFTYNLPNMSQIQQSYTFYFVTPSDVFFMVADTTNINPPRLGGELILQDPSQVFDAKSLGGTSIATGTGLDTNASVLAGFLTGDGASIVNVIYDQNDSGTVTTGNAIGGTYIADPSRNGHIIFTGLGTRIAAAYLIGKNQGFLVGSDGAVTYGLLDAQTIQPVYALNSLQGGYTLSAGTTFDPAALNVIGETNSPGLGILSGTIDEVDNNGTPHLGQPLQATYSLTGGTNGRGTMVTNSLTGLPVNIIYYIVSPSTIRAISADPSGTTGHPEVIYFDH